MARPLPSGKSSVNLAAPVARVSRIRRDPPPLVKEKPVDIEGRDQWDVIVGIIAFALAIFVLILAFSGTSGSSPREIVLNV